MTDRKRNAKLGWWISSVAITCVLLLRGHYLLGPSVGITFAFMTLAIAVIGYRYLCIQTPTRTGVVMFSIFAMTCTAIMFTPATFSPDVQHFINKYKNDRTARRELATLLEENADYRDIRFETEQLKVVFVSIRGTVPNGGVIDSLLADLSRLDFVRYCSLDGRLTARDTGAVHEFSDDHLHFDTENDADNQ
ncbi:hypothetical protein CA85_42190 [Allorhodopirellula solitaria]|uniref:Uncharacterized protein n=2 Tax=Allorhodopirellula solitaria TaxID=2527987 RepID=A0A5C5X0D2_9BACT|nr:hypothetical protein CA85_42190 [Allorhodopirellula solitaria]